VPLIAKIAWCECDKCGKRAELFVKAEHGWQRPCSDPSCTGTMATSAGRDYQLFHGNRRFAGTESESINEGCHPADVATHRKLMGSAADCLRDDGTVHFSDRAEQRKYVRKLREVGLA
jgi:hypothetical protein